MSVQGYNNSFYIQKVNKDNVFYWLNLKTTFYISINIKCSIYLRKGKLFQSFRRNDGQKSRF